MNKIDSVVGVACVCSCSQSDEECLILIEYVI